jgi:8-oxo-dGTP pyrophosphatase MutT (NUDIX family)
MRRDDVRALLLAREPADAKEERDRHAMLAFLTELPEPFSRNQAGAHFTASALVLDPARARTALVHHRKLGIWVQPGGHLERGDASIAAAALREVREELGLDGSLGREDVLHLDIHEIPGGDDVAAVRRPGVGGVAADASGPEPPHLHLDVRFLVIADGNLSAGDESIEARWFALDEAAESGDASVARLVASL